MHLIPDTNYKLNTCDKEKIIAAARRALMAANAHYHSWPSQQQEYFRATMDEHSRHKVRRVLLDSLLGIKCNDSQVEEVWDDVPLPELNKLNWASLLTSGIGEDYIYLNESMDDDKTLLDFKTLYDYDYDDHLFQEQARRNECNDYQGADYYAYRHPSWIRLLIDSRFYYATFTSLATHIIDELDTTGNDSIGQLIPHDYVEGKKEKGSSIRMTIV